ncbi:MAG: MFS transporter, partial [Nitrospinae bacterium]|nr:MFS transporter [Nitrospinota bacterium]
MSSRIRQLATPVMGVARHGLQPRQSVLLICCVLHSIHDGFTSAMYLLFPLLASELHLSYAQVGTLKMLVSGGQSLFQLPGGLAAERLGEAGMLALGLAALSGAFLLLAPAGSFVVVATLCLLIGIGASMQHPLSSSLVSRAYETQGRRTAMGTYNFAGDVGKVAFPAVLSGLILLVGWRGSVELLGALGLFAALLVWMGRRARETGQRATPDGVAGVQKPRSWGIV